MKTFLAVSSAVTAMVLAAEITVPTEKIAAMPHPRLLLPAIGIEKLRANAQTEVGRLIAAHTLNIANQILTEPPVKYKVEYGDRTLPYTRKVQQKCIYLAVAYQLTGERRYAERCVQEVMAAVKLPSWFRRFYLDTAELTFAVAIGYDWCYDAFTPRQREEVIAALINKGIKLSYDPEDHNKTWWIKAAMNQNQVIHTCLVAAAAAVAEADPELARDVIIRAVENLPRSMKAAYHPSGAYPEGPGYWMYGTNFNCILLAILEGLGGGVYGLDRQPGFSETGDYHLASFGTSGQQYTYADSGNWQSMGFAQYYLGHRFNRPDYLTDGNIRELKKYPEYRFSHAREIPLALLYADRFTLTPDRSRASTFYYSGAQARIPIIMMRTSFDGKSAYVGIKGGVPDGSHGHMDVGSFVYDVRGKRWVDDPGTFNYGVMEKITRRHKGGKDFNKKFFHVGPAGHSIFQINRQHQKSGSASKTLIADAQQHRVVFDLSAVYAGQAASAIREWRLLPDDSLLVTDTLTGVKPGASVVFHFLSAATPEKISGKTLLLSAGGKRLRVTAETPESGTWRNYPLSEIAVEGEPLTPKGLSGYSISFKVPSSGNFSVTYKFMPEQ